MTWLCLGSRCGAALAATLVAAGCAVGVENVPNHDDLPSAAWDGGAGAPGWPDGSTDAGDASVPGNASTDAGFDAAAAAGDAGAPPSNGKDAQASAPDAHLGLADAGHEGDAGAHDAGEPDAHTADAGWTLPKTLDGQIDADEWRGASSASQQVASDWGPNRLVMLAADVDESYLGRAVRGSLENDKNALVVYLDTVEGAGTTVRAIVDQTGEDELDDALSAKLDTPADFLADFAWGTLRMPCNVRGSAARTGLRGLANPADLAWVDAPTPPEGEPSVHTVCTADACEVRIPRATLPGTGPIRLFARLTNSDGEAFANQTLPLDDPSHPAQVQALLTVPR